MIMQHSKVRLSVQVRQMNDVQVSSTNRTKRTYLEPFLNALFVIMMITNVLRYIFVINDLGTNGTFLIFTKHLFVFVFVLMYFVENVFQHGCWLYTNIYSINKRVK